jgi:large subunit ribosomal protein L21
MQAIIETGGRQYSVTLGQKLRVEKLDNIKGDTVEIDKVLMISEGDKVTVGKPTIAGAKVVATVDEQGRRKKVVVGKFKAKTRYHRKTGHHQLFTALTIDKIVEP